MGCGPSRMSRRSGYGAGPPMAMGSGSRFGRGGGTRHVVHHTSGPGMGGGGMTGGRRGMGGGGIYGGRRGRRC